MLSTRDAESMPNEPVHADTWPAARTHPHTYPGATPDHDYALVDGIVHRLRFADPDDLTTAEIRQAGGGWARVDDELARRRLPLLGDRYAVLAYGSNRNPANLALKMSHYGYRSPGVGLVMPMVRARVRAAEAVAAGFSDQGFFYAGLLLGSGPDDPTADALDLWLNLVDVDQLRVLHESEGVGAGFYRAGVIDSVQLLELRAEVSAFVYLLDSAVPVERSTSMPLAFAHVDASGRQIPALGQTELFARLLPDPALTERLAALTGIEPAPMRSFAPELMKYLNGQWWYSRNTGEPPLLGARDALELIRDELTRHVIQVSNLDHINSRGRLLDDSDAFTPGDELTIAADSS